MTTKEAQIKLPFNCPRCDWFGAFVQSGGETTCPVCESTVSPLRQKGLDNLRTHYRLLLKIGYKTDWTIGQRSAEQDRLERFFESIGEPL